MIHTARQLKAIVQNHSGGNSMQWVSMDAHLENMNIPIKIDMSAGDIITPKEIIHKYKLMFEKREIDIFAYNIETVLSEKLLATLVLGDANTRLRDYYDIYILLESYSEVINAKILKKAFESTSLQRGVSNILHNGKSVIKAIEKSEEMQKLWEEYGKNFSYAKNISWDKIIIKVNELYRMVQ